MSPGDPSTSLRCAVLHGAQGVDPCGTAPLWDAVLIVEVPTPWPWDISETHPFRSLCDPPAATIHGADGRIWRPQGVLPADPAAGVRVMTRESPDGVSGPFELREWLLPPRSPDLLVRLCTALLECDERAEQRERLRHTLQRIDTLPSGLRDVVRLRLLNDQPTEQVCQALQISEENLFVRLHRARRQLQS